MNKECINGSFWNVAVIKKGGFFPGLNIPSLKA